MNNNWEKELRTKWSISHGITTIDFIIQEVKLARQEARKELIEEIEKGSPKEESELDMFQKEAEGFNRADGFNRCLKEIKDLLQSLKNKI